MGLLDDLKKKKEVMGRRSWQGTDDYHDWHSKSFDYKHGKGAGKVGGLDYAKSYDYKPNILEKFLDKVPGVGGYRDYKRVQDYKERVHFNPSEYKASDLEMQRGVHVKGKSRSDYQQVNDKTIDNRFSSGHVATASENPRNFSAQMFVQDKNYNIGSSFIQGTESGHWAQDENYNMRSMDPHNITSSSSGHKILGVFPTGYKGKITSNRAEGGGSKLNPYINPATLTDQVMGNKNLAIANEDYYADKSGWKTRKDFNKAAEASNKRWEGYAK